MNIMPVGESIRKAIKWISESLIDSPGKPISELIQQASLRYDLPPKDVEFLTAFYKKDA